MHTFKATIKSLIVIIILLIIAALVYIYSGAYNIGTDVHHNAFTHWILGTVRERSIDVHSEGIKVPPLKDPALIALGAHQYAHTCSGCHLAPGMANTDIRQGLYPEPPQLYKFHHPVLPAEGFWVIKHGIKFTAMPGWGATHTDHQLWAIIAFLQKLPSMTSAQYASLTGEQEAHAAMKPAASPTPASASTTATPASASTAAAPASAASTH